MTCKQPVTPAARRDVRGCVGLLAKWLGRAPNPSNAADAPAEEAPPCGAPVTIRAIRPDDKTRLVAAFRGLEPHTIRMRFFHAKRELSEKELGWIDRIDPAKRAALVATVRRGGDEVVVGEGQYAARGGSAEIAFTVDEEWQRRGLGRRLLQHLARIARRHGISRFEAYVLAENAPMLALFRRSGLPMTTRAADGSLLVTLALD